MHHVRPAHIVQGNSLCAPEGDRAISEESEDNAQLITDGSSSQGDISSISNFHFGARESDGGSPSIDSSNTNRDDDAISYESDVLSDNLKTLEELLDELKMDIGPDKDKELWKIRKFIVSHSYPLIVMLYQLLGNDTITEEDRDNTRAFKLKFTSTMSRTTFNQMRQVFSHKMTLNSEYRILK